MYFWDFLLLARRTDVSLKSQGWNGGCWFFVSDGACRRCRPWAGRVLESSLCHESLRPKKTVCVCSAQQVSITKSIVCWSFLDTLAHGQNGDLVAFVGSTIRKAVPNARQDLLQAASRVGYNPITLTPCQKRLVHKLMVSSGRAG